MTTVSVTYISGSTHIEHTITLHDSTSEPDTEFHCGLPVTDIFSGGNFPHRAVHLLYPVNYKVFHLNSKSITLTAANDVESHNQLCN